MLGTECAAHAFWIPVSGFHDGNFGSDHAGGSIIRSVLKWCIGGGVGGRNRSGVLLEAWPKSPKNAPKVQKIALFHIRFSSPKPVRSGFSAASLGIFLFLSAACIFPFLEGVL
jgi:hypothetical protein